MALTLPEADEGSHMGHADFRVGGKIFATLGYPSDKFAVVMVTPQDQEFLIRDYPKVFAPAAGKWGPSGSTTIALRGASKRAVALALDAAWRKRAPSGPSLCSTPGRKMRRTLPNGTLSPDQVVALLADNPSRITRLTAPLTPAQLRAKPAPDEWSANDVLAHLRCCADVWGKGLHTILEKSNPTITAVSPRGWIKRTNYLDLDFATSLAAFVAQRTELLNVLQPLSADDWERTATIKASGKSTRWTLRTYAERLANHEHHHLAQFERLTNVR